MVYLIFGYQRSMKTYSLVFLILFNLAFLSSTANSEPLEIKVMDDFIPQANGKPRNEATIFLLEAIKEIQNEINIQFVPASRLREWKQLSMLPDVCLYNKLKTPEREANALFTRYPIMAFPANRLIVFNMPTLPDSLSLEKAINDYDLTIGVTSGRSYSADIDTFIKNNEKHFFKLEGATNASRLGQMLFQNKIDAIIEYRDVFINRYQRAARTDKIRYLTIEPDQAAVFGYIACSPSPQGRQAIALFDRALQSERVKTLISKRLSELFPAPEQKVIIEAFNNAYVH